MVDTHFDENKAVCKLKKNYQGASLAPIYVRIQTLILMKSPRGDVSQCEGGGGETSFFLMRILICITGCLKKAPLKFL